MEKPTVPAVSLKGLRLCLRHPVKVKRAAFPRGCKRCICCVLPFREQMNMGLFGRRGFITGYRPTTFWLRFSW